MLNNNTCCVCGKTLNKSKPELFVKDGVFKVAYACTQCGLLHLDSGEPAKRHDYFVFIVGQSPGNLIWRANIQSE